MPGKRGKNTSKASKNVSAKRSPSKKATSRRSAQRRADTANILHVGVKSSIKIVFTNLVVFLVLFLISLTLWSVLQGIFQNLFFVFTVGFGVISVAFLITLVVLFFLKLLTKKR